jgi:hypothetical protein
MKMPSILWHWLLAGLGITVCCGGDPGFSPHLDPLKGFPKLVLWAWERPEDLSFIDPVEVGVAYLAATVRLKGPVVEVYPRSQPLRIPPHTSTLAVIRIESLPANAPALSADQQQEVTRWIRQLLASAKVSALQIDFDARLSERSFYRDLLTRLKEEFADLPLSMTALASWCFEDRWIVHTVVDEAVPMLFQMGPDSGRVVTRLKQGADFAAPRARFSVGLSTDERTIRPPAGRRLYLFHPRPWSEKDLEEYLAWLNQ